MALRGDYIQLIGRLNELLAELTTQIANERPGDPEVRDVSANVVQQMASRFSSPMQSTDLTDGGDAARIGIGDETAPDLMSVPTPSGVSAYDEQVVAERLHSVGDLYYCYCHDRLGVWRAVYALQDQFRAGQLRLSDGPGALGLYRFDLKRTLRYGHAQRMSAYRRVFGYTNAQSPAGSRPNMAFHGLFAAFCQEIAQLFRDKRVASVVQGAGASISGGFGSIASARRAGLDLRANVKRASYGDANVLSVELLQLLRSAFDILGARDVMQQFGTDNAWDTLEEVLQRLRGEQVTASLRSRMAIAGREVLHWLSHDHILTNDRAGFEARLQIVSEYAEEWLTSARSLGVTSNRAMTAQARNNRSPQANVFPFPGRMVNG